MREDPKIKRKRWREARARSLKKIFVSEFVEAIVAAILIAVVLRVFVVGVYRIPTESMMPTLIPGDFIVAWKTSYGVKVPGLERRLGARQPVRGDVVVFQWPGEDGMFVKRVVGLEGDRIEIRDGTLIVNDVVVSKAMGARGDWDIYEETNDSSTHRVMKRRSQAEADFVAPLIVPPGQVYVLGDLRSESFDSRQWGSVSVDQIIARASFIGFSVRITGRDDDLGVPEALSSKAGAAPTGAVRFGRVFRPIP